MSDLVPREELLHAVETRRELGPGYEDEVADAFIAKLEQRLAKKDSQLQRRRHHQKELILGSMAVSIPLLAIAGNYAGVAGIALVCLVLAVIAIVSSRST